MVMVVVVVVVVCIWRLEAVVCQCGTRCRAVWRCECTSLFVARVLPSLAHVEGQFLRIVFMELNYCCGFPKWNSRDLLIFTPLILVLQF